MYHQYTNENGTVAPAVEAVEAMAKDKGNVRRIGCIGRKGVKVGGGGDGVAKRIAFSKNSLEKKKLPEKEQSFKEDMVEFIQNFTLHCYRWLVEPNQHSCEYILWLLVHIIGFTSVVFILINAWNSYFEHPLVTTLYDSLFPISKVPFPAIAICNNNRISRKAAWEYAKELSERDPHHHDEAHYFKLIQNMGKIYDFDDDNANEYIKFQAFLDQYDTSDTMKPGDTSVKMRKLSPQCSSMLLRCIWRGIEQPCMLEPDMFRFRSTQYGYCCTFNYVRPDLLEQTEPPSFFINETGPDMGLIVLINGSATDYYYPLYNFVGFIVQVFNPNEFPDVPSGSVSEKLIELGTETFIRIDSITLQTEDDVHRYSPETRGCLFTDELKEDFGGRYKRSDCVVNCRVASIIALCGCIPFYLPLTNMGKTDDNKLGKQVPNCSMEQIPCLNHYRAKWSTMLLELKKISGLEKEEEDGLYCPACLPSCSDSIYRVSATSLPLIKSRRKNPNILDRADNVSELALIRIFFGQPETWLYKQRVSIKWYEMISNFGGICGVITGFSIICTIEIVYFCLKQIISGMINFVRRHEEHFITFGYLP